jgi:hypothetical protein
MSSKSFVPKKICHICTVKPGSHTSHGCFHRGSHKCSYCGLYGHCKETCEDKKRDDFRDDYVPPEERASDSGKHINFSHPYYAEDEPFNVGERLAEERGEAILPKKPKKFGRPAAAEDDEVTPMSPQLFKTALKPRQANKSFLQVVDKTKPLPVNAFGILMSEEEPDVNAIALDGLTKIHGPYWTILYPDAIDIYDGLAKVTPEFAAKQTDEFIAKLAEDNILWFTAAPDTDKYPTLSLEWFAQEAEKARIRQLIAELAVSRFSGFMARTATHGEVTQDEYRDLSKPFDAYLREQVGPRWFAESVLEGHRLLQIFAGGKSYERLRSEKVVGDLECMKEMLRRNARK